MKKDYDKIKDVYGEQTAKLCRSLFPTFLERDGWLFNILSKKFAPNHDLGKDIIIQDKVREFKDFIYSFDQFSCEKVDVNKSVLELFEEAGYHFYECNTYKDMCSFKDYYREDEILCSFFDDRLSTHYVFWVVKKNVFDIEREDIPTRDGDYGTSVMSIQFTRGKNNTVSIKNRYNHHVENADATLSNNLENIAVGLTRAFEKEYGFHIDVNESIVFDLNKYVKASDGRYYKFNMGIQNIYYCPNNVIIDNGKVISFDTSRYFIMDYYIVDMKEKRIYLYDSSLKDSFASVYQYFDDIKIVKNGDCKVIRGIRDSFSDVIFNVNFLGEIIGIKDDNLKNIGFNFMRWNEALCSFDCPYVMSIGNSFLSYNNCLEEFNCSNVFTIGDGFLKRNYILREINLDSVRLIGDDFMEDNRCLDKLELPNVFKIGNNCLYFNENSLREVCVPNLNSIGDNAFSSNFSIKKIDCRNLESVGSFFMYLNKKVKDFYFPRLSFVKDGFFGNNKYWRIKKDEYLNNIGLRKKLVRYKR